MSVSRYQKSRKDIFLDEYLPSINANQEFTTDEVVDWFALRYSPGFPPSSIELLLRYLSDNARPKALPSYPVVITKIRPKHWQKCKNSTARGKRSSDTPMPVPNSASSS